jgi:indole-3-glycerol phosphate synthase
MSMLSEILATKKTEVELRRRKCSLEQLEQKIATLPPTRNFLGALLAAPRPAIIAEVKKASPSKGVIREDFDPVEIAKIYAANGAACLSVLTDEQYFQGHLDYLCAIRKVVDIPILRKDFTVDVWQAAETRAAGADAILLIVAALSSADLAEGLAAAKKYGLTALVEVHDADELEQALACGAELIGINNRDLHTFRTTLSTTVSLLKRIPADRADSIHIVSESGIFTAADIAMLRSAGVTAALVGEALMREADIGAKLRELTSI